MKLSIFTIYLFFSGYPMADLASDQQATSLELIGIIECTSSCPWDFDGSGFVEVDNDLLTILGQYGTETDEGCEVGDFDENGSVDINDFREFLAHLSSTCE